MKTNTAFLDKYCSFDDYRDTLKRPWEITYEDKQFYVATNAHIAVLIPCTYFEDKLIYDNNHPDILRVLNIEEVEPYKIDSKLFVSVLMTSEMVDEYNNDQEDCEDCDGSGETECFHCGHDMKCEKCNGKGILKEATKTGNRIPSDKNMIKILDKHFKSNLLFMFIDIIKLSECEYVEVIKSNEGGANLFRLNDIYILLMPCLGFDYEEYKCMHKFN